MNFSRLAHCLAVVAAIAFPAAGWAADWTWTYSVRVSATVQASPARVTLTWPTDEIPATGYTVRRKLPDERWWGSGVTLSAGATSFVDDNVALGGTYEYQIEKGSALYPAFGYIRVAINAPLVESRGKVVLVVDRSIAGAVSNELKRLERDLVGDGWGVVRKEVARDDRPENVRRLIQQEWEADRANTRSVFLFGRVPVARSGNLNVDGHGSRPMPADAYYGEMDGRWSDANGDGILDQTGLTSDVELEVGRVDFADLPGAYAAAPFPGEVELLKRYLDKDHAYRFAEVRPPPRALMGNVGGDGRGQAYAASGYRTFAALVGAGNVDEAGVDLLAPLSERWITKLTTNEYQWAYAAGAGGDYSLGILGTHGQYNDLWGADFIEQRPKATFYMVFGSWLSEWTRPDNLMRTILAAPTYGLGSVWSGRPHHFCHTMGSGQTIGDGVRLTQNNNGLFYRSFIQRHLRSLHIALMGDPTLRLHQVAPPTNLQAAPNGGEVTLTWNASADSVFGYRVYRSAAAGAPFERISSELHTETRFVDRPERPAEAVYMVRAVALHLGASGSYYLASQGAFSRDDFAIPALSSPALPAVI
ncbi:MAG: fibronectin type III domain-containing protein, partial [Opitutaceae bacterium]